LVSYLAHYTKTETQALGKGGNKLQIPVYGQQLTQVDKFIYLGGSIGIDGTEEDVNRRVGLARGNFQAMNKVWTSKDISKATKLQVYETMILSTLLYNSETWTLKKTQQNRLKVFEMSCLRKIEGVTRGDHIRNEDIFDRLKLSQDIHSRIQQ